MNTSSADGGKLRVARTPDLEERIVEHVAGVPGIKRESAPAFPGGHMPVWRGFREKLLFFFDLKCERV